MLAPTYKDEKNPGKSFSIRSSPLNLSLNIKESRVIYPINGLYQQVNGVITLLRGAPSLHWQLVGTHFVGFLLLFWNNIFCFKVVPSNFRVADGTSPSPGFTYQKTPSTTTCVDVVILQTRQTLSKDKDVDPEDLLRYLRKDDLQQKVPFFLREPPGRNRLFAIIWTSFWPRDDPAETLHFAKVVELSNCHGFWMKRWPAMVGCVSMWSCW